MNVDDKSRILEELNKDGIYCKSDLCFGLLLQCYIRLIRDNLDDVEGFEKKMLECYNVLPLISDVDFLNFKEK